MHRAAEIHSGNCEKDLKFYVAFPVHVLYPGVVIFIFIT